MKARFVETLGTVYHRYGPGRLPGADRRDLGGGYAFASAMVVFWLAYVLNSSIGVGWSGPNPVFLEDPVPAVIACSLVVTCGFVAGYLAWRYLPTGIRFSGPVAGFVASLVTHFLVVSLLGVFVVAQVGYYSTLEKVVGALVFPFGGFLVVTRDLLDVALVLYVVGIAGGYVYERLRAEGPN